MIIKKLVRFIVHLLIIVILVIGTIQDTTSLKLKSFASNASKNILKETILSTVEEDNINYIKMTGEYKGTKTEQYQLCLRNKLTPDELEGIKAKAKEAYYNNYNNTSLTAFFDIKDFDISQDEQGIFLKTTYTEKLNINLVYRDKDDYFTYALIPFEVDYKNKIGGK